MTARDRFLAISSSLRRSQRIGVAPSSLLDLAEKSTRGSVTPVSSEQP